MEVIENGKAFEKFKELVKRQGGDVSFMTQKEEILKIVSIITTSNKESLSFHKKLGFNTLANIKNVAYKHGKWLDVTFMDKDIQTIIK